MDIQRLVKRERLVWHKHFIPSLIAGVAVALIALLYEMTISNIILFASVGASAVILTNFRSHHLTKLHTTIMAYIIAVVVSYLIFLINTKLPIPLVGNIFIAVFVVSMCLFLFNAFPPPAITASLSFILLERPPNDLIFLFVAVILLLIAVRFITYVFSQHLSIYAFLKEFKREVKKEEKKFK